MLWCKQRWSICGYLIWELILRGGCFEDSVDLEQTADVGIAEKSPKGKNTNSCAEQKREWPSSAFPSGGCKNPFDYKKRSLWRIGRGTGMYAEAVRVFGAEASFEIVSMIADSRTRRGKSDSNPGPPLAEHEKKVEKSSCVTVNHGVSYASYE